MRIAALVAMLLLTGCPQAGDDDDAATPRVVILDDDDAADDDDATDEGTPVSEPGTFLSDCSEVEPNDAPVLAGETITLDPPWENATDCGTLPAGPGALLAMRGRIGHVIQQSWEGDSDSFVFTTSEEISPRVVVQWDPLVGDFDARLWCDTSVGYQDAAGGGLATTGQPEEVATTAFTIDAGVPCYLFVVNFEGAVADYVAWIEVD
ncbi:MAG: hypothetical protein KDA24_19805 [Deltaproteobacteria bacterium]|nr:hypothetical protein [Deltaproteobacteria bacterium]